MPASARHMSTHSAATRPTSARSFVTRSDQPGISASASSQPIAADRRTPRCSKKTTSYLSSTASGSAAMKPGESSMPLEPGPPVAITRVPLRSSGSASWTPKRTSTVSSSGSAWSRGTTNRTHSSSPDAQASSETEEVVPKGRPRPVTSPESEDSDDPSDAPLDDAGEPVASAVGTPRRLITAAAPSSSRAAMTPAAATSCGRGRAEPTGMGRSRAAPQKVQKRSPASDHVAH